MQLEIETRNTLEGLRCIASLHGKAPTLHPMDLGSGMDSLNQNNTDTRRMPHADLVRTLRLESSENERKRTETKAFLNVIRSDADLGVHVFVDSPVVLGRDPNCAVPLHDFGVSRRHASITPLKNGSYLLRDLDSTNGTRVNGSPVLTPTVLTGGEKIFVGDTVLRFAIADEVEIDFHSEIATLVSTDPLTGLPAKRRFDQAFEFSLQTAKKGDTPLSLLMMDMDGVKQINDTHGHLFGAHVIGETGRIISRTLGTKGQACRFGGDEFSAFLANHDLESAAEVAETIRVAVETAGMEKNGIPLQPTLSIGIACYPAIEQALDLVMSADKALYLAKAKGKNQVALNAA